MVKVVSHFGLRGNSGSGKVKGRRNLAVSLVLMCHLLIHRIGLALGGVPTIPQAF